MLNYRIDTVTPEMAKDFLAKNIEDNRGIRKSVVDQYARDMKAGNWKVTGEAIVFNSNGQLSDGQHRLNACVKAGVSFESVIVEGIDIDATVVAGQGAKRSGGDAISMALHHSQAYLINSATRILDRFSSDGVFNKAINYSNRHRSNSETLDSVERYPDLPLSFPMASKMKSLCAPAIAAATHYMLSRKSRNDSNEFFRGLSEGSNLVDGSPVLALRNLLINRRKFGSSSDMERMNTIHYIFKAWNLYREGKKISILKIGCAEEIPVPL